MWYNVNTENVKILFYLDLKNIKNSLNLCLLKTARDRRIKHCKKICNLAFEFENCDTAKISGDMVELFFAKGVLKNMVYSNTSGSREFASCSELYARIERAANIPFKHFGDWSRNIVV